MTAEEVNLAAALTLAGAGVRIFPCGADKRPLFKSWQEIATNDADQVRAWWTRAPYALPAIPCGANGIIVLDLDRHPGAADGVLAFKELVSQHGGLPPGVPMVARQMVAGCTCTLNSLMVRHWATGVASFRPASTSEAKAASSSPPARRCRMVGAGMRLPASPR